jgi:hypothetical protein
MDSTFSTIEVIVSFVIFGTIFVYVLIIWILELLFYWSNKWDFSKDSGFRGSIGPSADAGLPVAKELTPKVRVLFALPFMLVVSISLIISLVFLVV